MADLDTAELRKLARRTAEELRLIVRTSNGDDAGHLAWRLSVLAKHVLSRLPADAHPTYPADTRPPTQ